MIGRAGDDKIFFKTISEVFEFFAGGGYPLSPIRPKDVAAMAAANPID